jgi:hypothetical protein
MNKFKKASIILLVFLVFLFGLNFLTSNNSSRQTQGFSQEIYANLKIVSQGNTQSFDISAFVGKTALEATESKIKVIKSGSGENAFITSINGYSADNQKREFWELTINGSEALVGAGSYLIKNHDEIQWKIDNY